MSVKRGILLEWIVLQTCEEDIHNLKLFVLWYLSSVGDSNWLWSSVPSIDGRGVASLWGGWYSPLILGLTGRVTFPAAGPVYRVG